MVIPKIQENDSSNIIKCYLNNLKINKKFYINPSEMNCNEGSQKAIIQEMFKRFYHPFFIPVLCLIACMQIMNNRFNNFYEFYKIMIFIFGFIILSTSEILIKYTGNNLINDIIIMVFPVLLFLSIYLFILKKNYT